MSGKKPKFPGYYEFLIPAGLDVEPLVQGLQQRLGLTAEAEALCRRTFYDTFDARLYRQGLLLEHVRCPHGHELIRTPLSGQEEPLQLACRLPPRTLDEIPSPLWRQQLAPVLEMRALLPMISLQSHRRRLRKLDDAGKTQLLIDIDINNEERRGGKRRPLALGTRLRVQPVRGYGKALTPVLVYLATLRLPQADELIALTALQAAGIQPDAYSSKYQLPLAADMRSDDAAKRILAYLLRQARLNEDGVVRDLDTEFLHDFRVALRRSRSLLEHCKGVFQPPRLAALQREIGWLAERTGPCRDLDVYLLDFPAYCRLLPEHLQAGLEPIHQRILHHRQAAHRQLLRALQSSRYQRLQQRWQAFVEQPHPQRTQLKHAAAPIQSLAAKRLRREFKNIIKDGRDIHKHSPPEALHGLRKTCKKARYLLEFFQDLLPKETLNPLIRALKGLQDVLGRYQDLAVQEQALQGFYLELHRGSDDDTDTHQAITILVKALHGQSAQSRLAFDAAFAEFDSPQNRACIHHLLSGTKTQTHEGTGQL